MRRFSISGYFYAEDIDDALWKLSQHFLTVLEDDPELDPLNDRPMELVVEPVRDGHDVP